MPSAKWCRTRFAQPNREGLGSAFISVPQDIADQPATGDILPASGVLQLGAAPDAAIDEVAKRIAAAQNPVFLLGLMASRQENISALHQLLEKSHIPITSTYQPPGR